jgi:hypothetical protein
MGPSLWRNYARGFEEPNETFPLGRTRESGGVGEIDSKAATEEQRFRLNRCRASLLGSHKMSSETMR